MPETMTPHEQLDSLVGDWKGTSTVWFEPTSEPQTADFTARMRIVADRFLVQEYETAVEGKPASGMVTYGFDTSKGKHVVALIDSFHTGPSIMLSEGEPHPECILDVLTHYGSDDEKWGWRTVVLSPRPDELVLLSYNIPPDGREYLAVKTELRRKQ